MEGAPKRIKTTDGDAITAEALQNISVDQQVEIMSHAANLRDLFTLGRIHLKTLQKERNVFGKWFNNRCNVPDVDNVVKQFFEHAVFYPDHIFVQLHNQNGNFTINMVVDTVTIVSRANPQPEWLKTYCVGWYILAGNEKVIYEAKTEYPIFEVIRLVNTFQHNETNVQYNNKQQVSSVDFSHKRPFDVLCLARIVILMYRCHNTFAGHLVKSFDYHRSNRSVLYQYFDFLRSLLLKKVVTVNQVFE